MPWGLLLNRYAIGAMIVVGLVIGARVWLAKHDAELVDQTIARINSAAEELADAAVEARAPALRPGAFARLRQDHCSNCTAELPIRAQRDDRQ
jgi:hypothetical protein